MSGKNLRLTNAKRAQIISYLLSPVVFKQNIFSEKDGSLEPHCSAFRVCSHSHQMSYLYLNTTGNEQEILCLNWTFSRLLRPEYLLCQKLNYRKVEQAPDLVASQNEEIHPPGTRNSCYQYLSPPPEPHLLDW